MKVTHTTTTGELEREESEAAAALTAAEREQDQLRQRIATAQQRRAEGQEQRQAALQRRRETVGHENEGKTVGPKEIASARAAVRDAEDLVREADDLLADLNQLWQPACARVAEAEAQCQGVAARRRRQKVEETIERANVIAQDYEDAWREITALAADDRAAQVWIEHARRQWHVPGGVLDNHQNVKIPRLARGITVTI